MGEAERIHVLQRKARTGRDEHQARVMSPARALRLAVAWAADDLFDLALSVSSIHVSQAGQDGTVAAFPGDMLIMVLDGPGGATGAAAVDMAVLGGLIEMQTVGQVLKRPGAVRQPTQTDAALVAPLVDAMLEGFAGNLAEEAGAGWVAGYRFGAMIEGPRMLGLLLEAPDFHLFRLQVDLGAGARQGEIALALPARPAVPQPAEDAGAEAEAGAAEARLRLGEGALLAAQAPLDAVLHRFRMPLAGIAALRPGDIIDIPREALAATRLELGRGNGAVSCRLGQINGHRAVRLSVAPGAAGRTTGFGAEDEMDDIEAPPALAGPDAARQVGSGRGRAV